MADTKKHDGYDAIREIIEKMRAAGFDKHADALSSRLTGVWTTGTELWAELVKVLSDFEATEHAEAFPALASQVKTVLTAKRKWFAKHFPAALDDGERPFSLLRSTLEKVDCLLVSAQGHGLKSPRLCQFLAYVRGPGGTNYMLVEIEPPLMATASRGGRTPVGQLLTSPVEPAGQLVLPIDRSVAVKVWHLLVPYESQRAVLADEMKFVGEADLHPPSASLSSMQAVTPD